MAKLLAAKAQNPAEIILFLNFSQCHITFSPDTHIGSKTVISLSLSGDSILHINYTPKRLEGVEEVVIKKDPAVSIPYML